MPRSTFVPILLACSLLAVSCDENDPISPTDPSATTVTTTTTFTATNPTTVQRPAALPTCPSVLPFVLDLGLVVRADGTFDVLVTEIRVQFTDINGTRMPQITLPAPVLTAQFGSALVAARSQRTFPLNNLNFGCTTSRRGTVVLFVDTRDSRGGTLTGTVKVPVS